MKAIVCIKYGPPDVLQLKVVEKPTPKSDEVLIRILATSVTNSDLFIRGSKIPLRFMILMRLMLGIIRPKNPIIGEVLAGKIEAVGADIKRFQVGDQVYGLTGFSLGAYAEYKCRGEIDSKQGCLALKPRNLSFEEATSAAYGGLLATQYMEKGNIKPGQEVLIYGASGTSGTIAVQLAKHLGARVTGICGTANLELVKSLGADTVLDYTREESIHHLKKYDFILDSVGKWKTSELKRACQKALLPGGKYVSVDDGALELRSDRLTRLKDLIETGIIKPVVDRCYPMEQIVEAHKYVESGHKKGGVAITV